MAEGSGPAVPADYGVGLTRGDGIMDALGERTVRRLSLAVLIGFTWFWHFRSTGRVSPAAWVLLAIYPLVWVSFGRLFVAATARVLRCRAGIAYELVVGFLSANTLLFVLTLVSPLGMTIHVGLLVALALLAATVPPTRRWASRGGVSGELASLVCIAFSGLAATLWVGDAQPVAMIDPDATVYRIWSDMFIHAREISAFAEGHGLSSLSDIKLGGKAAPIYHFASYMFPAALHALTATSAIDSFVAFMLPFGIVLSGLAAFVLVSAVFRTIWPGVIAAAAIVALPDAYQQGAHVRYLSYHFMTQVNLTMFYGLACISIAWVFMIEACRRAGVKGILIAYAFLAICLTYKAHLFVANALVLMLYPCALFAREDGRIRVWWRVLAAIAVIVAYALVISWSQQSPRVPTLRYDFSGGARYLQILMDSAAEGRLKTAFEHLYFWHRLPHLVNGLLILAFIGVGSFGLWIVVTPLVYRTTRHVVDSRAWGFVLLVTANYLFMSTALSLDKSGSSTPEELVNRPHAWAYFVVVAFTAAAFAAWLPLRHRPQMPLLRWISVPVALAMLVVVQQEAHELQTFPEGGRRSYAAFNRVPTCQVRAAEYVRDHGKVGDVLQDSQFDPRFITTAISERQAYVLDSDFGGSTPLKEQRMAEVDAVRATADPQALESWARANRIGWFLMHPEDSMGWDAHFLGRAAFACGNYRVFHFPT